MAYFAWKPYVSAAERRRKAAVHVQKLAKKGQPVAPVIIEGRTIARTFWGKSWCANLERYSDYASRLPRGRTYVRNGSVADLKIARGEIAALVSGSEIYKVRITIAPASQPVWKALCKDCAGSIDSLVELLQGRFSKGVMERVCLPDKGLFPSPKEIGLSCSCPDWADMCKHVAAVLYGVGARLDASPELLFTLRGVDHTELLARAGEDLPLAKKPASSKRVMAGGDLGAIFGLEIAETSSNADAPAPNAPAKKGQKEPAARAKVPAKAAAGKVRAAPLPEKSAKAKSAKRPQLSCALAAKSSPRTGTAQKVATSHATQKLGARSRAAKTPTKGGDGGGRTDKANRNSAKASRSAAVSETAKNAAPRRLAVTKRHTRTQ